MEWYVQVLLIVTFILPLLYILKMFDFFEITIPKFIKQPFVIIWYMIPRFTFTQHSRDDLK